MRHIVDEVRLDFCHSSLAVEEPNGNTENEEEHHCKHDCRNHELDR